MGGSIDEDNHRSASADINQKPKLLPLVTRNFTMISGQLEFSKHERMLTFLDIFFNKTKSVVI